MENAALSAESLRQKILETEKQLDALKIQLAQVEQSTEKIPRINNDDAGWKWPLSQEEYTRYGRQMIVPSIGIEGQLRLHNASVLIVGAGGLGCPAAAYIAGAGVKTLGIVDGDTVEVSNLHRQILHTTETVDKWKVDSAIAHLKRFNPHVQYNAYREHLSPQNALEIISEYDLVLDCTDHPKSRYLISDACVLLCKPLISASALKTEGQLTVLNYPPRPAGSTTGGPCYRCVFPKPPPADQVVSCGDGGIVGPVVGAMGVLQALEAIKMISTGIDVGTATATSEFDNLASVKPSAAAPSLLIFSSMSASPFRTVRLRTRRPACFACSSEATLTKESLSSGSLDYVAFCGEVHPVKLLGPEERMSAREYAQLQSGVGRDHVLVDVREKVQFDICSLEGSVNIPFSSIQGGEWTDVETWMPGKLKENAPIYVVCRLGNDSQVAAKRFMERLGGEGKREVKDIVGGLRSWKAQVNKDWPDY